MTHLPTIPDVKITQRSTLQLLAIIMKRRGHPPSIRELMRELQMGVNDVMERLEYLRSLGLVTFEERKARTIVAVCRFIPEKRL